jgi:hypothetical protein
MSAFHHVEPAGSEPAGSRRAAGSPALADPPAAQRGASTRRRAAGSPQARFAAALADPPAAQRGAAPSPTRVQAARRNLSKEKTTSTRHGTKRQYGNFETLKGGVIGEFADWCCAGSGEVVRGVLTLASKKAYEVVALQGTVLMYFDEHLKHRKKLTSAGTVRKANEPIDRGTYDQHAKALVSFHTYCVSQQLIDKDEPPPNGGGALTEVKNLVSKKKAATRAENYGGRGKAAIRKDYDKDQHRQMCRFGVADDAARPARSPSKVGQRVHLHHIMAHTCAVRFDDREQLRYADMCLDTAPEEEGPMKCEILCFGLDHDKTNADGCWRLAGAMRHVKNPFECLHCALALSLHHDFQVAGVLPSLEDFKPRQREDGVVEKLWYDYYLFHGEDADGRPDPRCKGTYQTAYDQIVHLFGSIRPPVSRNRKVLHLSRGVTDRDSEYHRVSKESRKKLGRWKGGADAHDRSYSNGLDFDSMRLKAGLPPLDMGHFYVARAAVRPSSALKSEVFSSLNELRTAISTGEIPKKDVDETLEGFLELMDYLSEVLLQDAAVMYEELKSHVLFSYRPFNTVEFSAFRDELLAAKRSAPHEELLLTHRQAAERGDKHTASVLGVVVNARSAAAPALSPLARLELSEVHRAVTSLPGASIQPVSLFAPAVRPPTALQQEAPADPLVVCDVRDAATWPMDAVPRWATSFLLGDYSSPQELTDEWERGRTQQLPPVKKLEEFYGAAKTCKVRGHSWRSPHWAPDKKSNAKDRAFSKRKVAFEYIKQHGEVAALAEMNRLLDLYVGGPKQTWRAMQYVLDQMRLARPGANVRSAAATARASTARTNKRPRLSEPPTPTST